MERTSIGEFEELCLLCVGVLDEDAYGVTIQGELLNRTNRNITISTIHSTLIRLEKKGYLQSRMGGATENRGGRTKRLFELTAEGKKAILTARDIRNNIWSDITKISWDSL